MIPDVKGDTGLSCPIALHGLSDGSTCSVRGRHFSSGVSNGDGATLHVLYSSFSAQRTLSPFLLLP